jgi:hypothetical protein
VSLDRQLNFFEIAALAGRLAEPGEYYPLKDGLALFAHVVELAVDRRFPGGRPVVDPLDGSIVLPPRIESLEAKMALIATTRSPLVSAGWQFGFRRVREGLRFRNGLSMVRVRESNDPEAGEAFVLTVLERAPSTLFRRKAARKKHARAFWKARDGRTFEAFKDPV